MGAQKNRLSLPPAGAGRRGMTDPAKRDAEFLRNCYKGQL